MQAPSSPPWSPRYPEIPASGGAKRGADAERANLGESVRVWTVASFLEFPKEANCLLLDPFSEQDVDPRAQEVTRYAREVLGHD